MKITTLQESFANGVVTPLLFGRTTAEGYQSGVAEMENMYPDSRGPSRGRLGIRYVDTLDGYNDGRVFSLSVNDSFFYTGIFVEKELIIGTVVGHNPNSLFNINANFVRGETGWLIGGDLSRMFATTRLDRFSSSVLFTNSSCELQVAQDLNKFVYISSSIALPNAGDFRILATFSGDAPLIFDIGTTENSNDVASFTVDPLFGSLDEIVTFSNTDYFITARLQGSNVSEFKDVITFFGVTDVVNANVEFTTPYEEVDVSTLQGVQIPEGNAIYILHELYPPHVLTYNRTTDLFTFDVVTFVEPPPQWGNESYPSTGDFFEGRLWLGGTVNEPQTFWASKSGLPEDFTLGDLADDALQFTLSKFGRIEWIVGFKNLLIGTQTGEHIVTSDAGLITPSDVSVEQQSSYGSANIQPVQVGDQVFYVSADRRKVRAIQYEWKADNWLSFDLTFNSENLTESGIKHIIWQQNPDNRFHCILENGSIATMTYERSKNIYGWSLNTFADGVGEILDASIGPINGTDFINVLAYYRPGEMSFESQTALIDEQYADSWVKTKPDEVGGLVVSTGLAHLEGFVCRVIVDGALQTDKTVTQGQITLEYSGSIVIIGLQFTQRMKTLPLDKGAQTGDGTPYLKRYNKIQVGVLNSAKPLINGVRGPTRVASTAMNTPELPETSRITVYDTGWDQDAQITIEQDLPEPLTIIAISGEVNQSIL